MSDSVQLAFVHEGQRSVWLYRLEDGSLRLSEVDSGPPAADVGNSSSVGLEVPRASVDRLAFALLVEKYRGHPEALQEVRRLLSSEAIDHVVDAVL